MTYLFVKATVLTFVSKYCLYLVYTCLDVVRLLCADRSEDVQGRVRLAPGHGEVRVGNRDPKTGNYFVVIKKEKVKSRYLLLFNCVIQNQVF